MERHAPPPLRAGPAPRPQPPVPRSRPGFTLVEILIVVAVLAIVAAMVVPAMGNTDATRLRAAADMLVSDIHQAAFASISHSGDPRMLVFDSATHRYSVVRAAAPSTPLTHPIDHQPYRTTFGQGRAAHLAGVVIHSYSLGGDARLSFGTYGQLDQGSAASVTLACNGKTLTITIDPVTAQATVGAIH